MLLESGVGYLIERTLYYNDIKSQAANNYDYDEIGNLIKDVSAGIGANSINWSVYGKILQINQTKNGAAQNITYTYDAAGNRISKTVNGATTWYVRDASGNTMAVYKAGGNTLNSGHITLQERHLYGSSRLGISSPNLDISAGLVIPLAGGITTTTNAFFSSFDRGQKFFELTNHLGNVLVTVSDKKLQVQGNGVTDNNGNCATGTATDVLNVNQRNGEANYIARTEVDFLPGFESNDNENFSAYIDNDLTACVPYTPPATPAQGWFYTADIISANDYAPGGIQMVGRTFNAGAYRYGFNGKEKDDAVKGQGNQIDYGMRIYDPKLGRFLSVDPLTSKYAFLTPYQFAGNSLILCLDVDGQEPDPFTTARAVESNRQWEENVRKTDPEHASQRIYEANKKAFLTVGSMLTAGSGPLFMVFTDGVIGYGMYNTVKGAVKKDQAQINEGVQDVVTGVMGEVGGIIVGRGIGLILGKTFSLSRGPIKEEIKYLFRGTSEGYEGAASLQKAGVTPTSTDPAVSAIFGIYSKNYGKGVLQIALPSDLQAVSYEASNVLAPLEKEVVLNIKPLAFADKAHLTISADQARTILGNMGIKIPAQINSVEEISNLLRNTPKLNQSQIDEFYKQASKIKSP